MQNPRPTDGQPSLGPSDNTGCVLAISLMAMSFAIGMAFMWALEHLRIT